MKIIEKDNLKILVPEGNKLLKDRNDFDDEPYLTNKVYLGIQIQTLEEAQELYEEVDYEENN